MIWGYGHQERGNEPGRRVVERPNDEEQDDNRCHTGDERRKTKNNLVVAEIEREMRDEMVQGVLVMRQAVLDGINRTVMCLNLVALEAYVEPVDSKTRAQSDNGDERNMRRRCSKAFHVEVIHRTPYPAHSMRSLGICVKTI